jgi:ATP-dependent DNA helicase DinG
MSAQSRNSEQGQDWEFRPQQKAMEARVRESFAGGFHALIEAGTGTGKSRAYLVPAIEWSRKTGKKVVVSTFTKALQEQLMSKELPFLNKASDFRYALCLGSQNFLCKRRFRKNNLPQLFTSAEDKERIKKITQWIETTVTGLISELPFRIDTAFWNLFNRDSDLCMRRKCPLFDECFYYRRQKEIVQANVLVVNHHLFFSHIASDGKVLPRVDAVIFDEAHTLEPVATTFFGYKISRHMVKIHLDALHSPSQDGLLRRLKFPLYDIKTGVKLVEDTRKAADIFFSGITDKLEARPQKIRIREKGLFDNGLTAPLNSLTAFALDILQHVQSKEDEREWLGAVKKLQDINDRVETILNLRVPNCVYWVEIERRVRRIQCSLNMAPLNISDMFKSQVLEKFSPVMAVSATLTANGRFDSFRDSLGFHGKTSALMLDSPFDYAGNVLLYLPRSMPDPVGAVEPAEYYERALKETKRLIGLTQGGAFVLFTNTAILRRAGSELSRAFPDLSILQQGDMPANGLMKIFRDDGNAVLLGTNTFWQGVDIPGMALRSLIIWKLPFAVPDEPVTEAKMELFRAQGKNPFFHYQLPRAIVMTRQGFGRLIRRKDDKGIVSIIDPRTLTKAYGKQFLDSLPSCQISSNFEDVKRFTVNNSVHGSSEQVQNKGER